MAHTTLLPVTAAGGKARGSTAEVGPEGSRGGALGTLAQLDKEVSALLFTSVGKAIPRSLLMLLEHSGNGLIWIPLLLVAWLLPFIHPGQRMLLSNLQLGFLLDLLVVGLIKALIRRSRPHYAHMSDYMLVHKVDAYSFPSGHASRVVLIALVTAIFVPPEQTWLRAVLITWAVATSASRVLLGRHYLFDVLAGVTVGILLTGALSSFSFRKAGMLISTSAGQRIHYKMVNTAKEAVRGRL